MPRLVGVLLTTTFLAVACGPPSLRPTSVPDPAGGCPGSWNTWSLEILDRRANREGSERLLAALRDAITKSFPGCAWTTPGVTGQPSVTIEIHRFAAPFVEGMWSGAAEWTVLARDPEERTLLEFEARADVDRPNYQGSNNEKEALQEVFRSALERTAAGLRSVSTSPRASSDGDTTRGGSPGKSLSNKGLSRVPGSERISQDTRTEAL